MSNVRGNQSKNILFFSLPSEMDGSERSLINYIDNAKLTNIRNSLITSKKGKLCRYMNSGNRGVENVKVIRSASWLSMGGAGVLKILWSVIVNIVAVVRLTRYITKNDIDLVYSISLISPAAAIAAILTGREHIWHAREILSPNSYRCVYGVFFLRLILKHPLNTLISNSQKTYDSLLAISGLESIIILNGILDKREKLPDKVFERRAGSRDKISILQVASVSHNKNQKFSVELMNALVKKGFKANLIMVGDITVDKAYLKELKELINKYNLCDHIKIIDFIEDLSDFYQKADFVLCPSLNESFGRVVLEAHSFRRPVIYYSPGYSEELFCKEAKQGGFKTFNSGLASNIIIKIFKNKDLYREISTKSYERAFACFTAEKYAKDIDSIIQQKLGL